MKTTLPLLALATGLLAAPARADVESGPKPGEKVPALKVFDVTGPSAGKELDYAAERKDKPTVYLFVQADHWSRPMARFLRELDKAAGEIGGETYFVAVWLTEEPRKTKEYLPRAQTSLNLQHTAFTFYPKDKFGPGEWGINSDAHLTAVVATRGKVAARFGHVSVNETVVPEVTDALKKALKEK